MTTAYNTAVLQLQSHHPTDFNAICLLKLMQSYSQLGQDVHAATMFKDAKAPYFIDIGAHDGTTLSNTYLLEKLGWKGICVEPNPILYKRLKAIRKKSHCCKAALFSESGKTFTFRKADLLGGIEDYLDTYKTETEKAETFTVQTKTLTDILRECNAPKFIQFMSLDTEGTELEILKGTDFDRYKFGLISVEHNYQEPRRSEMKVYLSSKGYKRLRKNEWDDDYIPRD